MKKLCQFIVITVAFLVYYCAGSPASALDFNPTVLTITGHKAFDYPFNGEPLTIPFNISGTSASLWLVINTYYQSYSIKDVRNGHLGWHYVNNIDTTIYISERYHFDPGLCSIEWDGNGQDGNPVKGDGQYQYYLWGYDDQTPRQRVSDYVQIGFGRDSQYTHVYETGPDGMPLSQPMLAGSPPWYRTDDTVSYRRHGAVFKWDIGEDPSKAWNLTTSWCDTYRNREYAAQFTYGGPILDPEDYNVFYHCAINIPERKSTVLRWRFIPDGQAQLDKNWLGWDEVQFEEPALGIAEQFQGTSLYSDRNYFYAASPGTYVTDKEWNKLRCYNYQDMIVFEKNLPEWYLPDDENENGYINGGFHTMYSREENRWVLLGHLSCLIEMISTNRILHDAEDNTDLIVWQNGNGDYFMDNGWREGDEYAWACLSDSEGDMRRDSIAIDKNGFMIIGTSFHGLTSFGIATQDGTGIGYGSFADEVDNDAYDKYGGQLVQSGSSYDGLYWSGIATSAEDQRATTNFIAFDSFSGIIDFTPDATVTGYFTMYSPSGGEILVAGTTTDIRWGVYGDSALKLEFSSDAGTSWQSIVDEINGNAGSYTWELPEVDSHQCLVRIKDNSLDQIQGISTRTFTIIPSHYKITHPNGGEIMEPGSACTIAWLSPDRGLEEVVLSYSTNNGTSWQIIDQHVQSETKTYSWIVPNELSDTCLIMIADDDDVARYDTSDTTFSIADTFIILRSPEGQEEWDSASFQSIYWETPSTIENITIDLSIDDGLSWEPCAENIDADKGVYWFNIPVLNSTQCRLRITAPGYPDLSATSGTPFTIKPFPMWLAEWMTFTTVDGLPNNIVTAVACGDDGTAWIGTQGTAPSYFDGIRWRTCNGAVTGIPSYIAVDQHGTVWFVSEQKPLTSFDGTSWRCLDDSPANITGIMFDSNNVMWMGTNGSGLYRRDGETVTNFTAENSELKTSSPRVLAVDHQNGVWIGYDEVDGDDCGASHFDGDHWRHYTDDDGLVSNNVCAAAVDHDGIVWFGTNTGVSRFDGSMWTTYITYSGLVNNSILSVTVDNNNVKWFGTIAGISRFDGQEWMKRILIGNVVQQIEVDKYNNKWFATNYGLTRFLDDAPNRVEEDTAHPIMFRLLRNYPNPFNPSTTITFTLPAGDYATLTIYNIAGQKVRKLLGDTMPAGRHAVAFNGSGLASGIYFYRLTAGGRTGIGRMLLVR